MQKLTSEQIIGFVSKPAFGDATVRSEDSSWPKISIVTPSYNQGRFLERTILSVLNQQYPNLEYIIMDGGSTDNSVEIIKKYERYLSYWTSGKDAGQGDAIQKGFRLCTGQVLAYLNSDDVYMPGALSRTAVAFRADPRVGVVYGNTCFTDEGDRIIGERRLTPYLAGISRLGFLYGGFGVSQPSTFWTRDLYFKTGEIDPAFVHCMDNDLFTRFALTHARFKFVREYLSCARMHADTKTATLRHVAQRESRMIKQKYGRCRNRVFALAYLAFIRMIRTAIHVVQGETLYVFRRKLKSWIS